MVTQMIENWLITGDTHGDFTRFRNYDPAVQNDPNTAVIILGDAGLNWTLGENDVHMKNYLSKRYAFRIYCVRGNHEARPSDVPEMHLMYDEDVHGEVWVQDRWPNIRYFKDVAIYIIKDWHVGVIGGAYSVDKFYRLSRGAIWYENEQLNEQERTAALNLFASKKVNFMLTHTCPITWEPTDLFLNCINQSMVDKSTENFLEEIKNDLDFDVWCWGHYHTDRIERPYAEIFFHDTEDLQTIWDRWKKYKETGELDWWLVKSPCFYWTDEVK